MSPSSEIFKNTEKLYYFYEVAQSGSFQSAARKLGTTASALSYSVGKLENITGNNIFIRSKHGVKMTGLGESLFLFCKKFFSDLEDICLHAHSKKSAIPLKFGTFPSIAIYLMPPLIEKLKEFDNISLSLSTNRSTAILESLIKKDIDIALSVGTFKHPNLISIQLYQDDYSFYASSDTTPETITNDWICKKPLLYMPDSCDSNNRPISTYINNWKIDFEKHFQLNSLEVIAQFARQGLGIGILPNKTAQTYKDLIKIKIPGDIPLEFGNHDFYLSYRNDLDVSQKVIQTFIHAAASTITPFAE